MANNYHQTGIVGIGSVSSYFAASLSRDVITLGPKEALAFAGVYDTSAAGDVARTVLEKLPIDNVSVTAEEIQLRAEGRITTREIDADIENITRLAQAIIRRNMTTLFPIEHLIWIVDSEKISVCVPRITMLKRVLPNSVITVICHLPDVYTDTFPFLQLKELAEKNEIDDQATIATTILIHPHSSLVVDYGAQTAMITRGLASLIVAPHHNSANPPMNTLVRRLNEAGFAFSGLVIDSAGVVMTSTGSAVTSRITPSPEERQGCRPSWMRKNSESTTQTTTVRHETVAARSIYECMTTLTAEALSGKSPSSVLDTIPNKDERPIHTNFLVPVSTPNKGFEDLFAEISRWLALNYKISFPSLVHGFGTDVAMQKPGRIGDAYCQLTMLFGTKNLRGASRLSGAETAEADGVEADTVSFEEPAQVIHMDENE